MRIEAGRSVGVVYKRSHLARRRNRDFELLKDTFQRGGGKKSGISNMSPSSSNESIDESCETVIHGVESRSCDGDGGRGGGRVGRRLRSCCGWTE